MDTIILLLLLVIVKKFIIIIEAIDLAVHFFLNVFFILIILFRNSVENQSFESIDLVDQKSAYFAQTRFRRQL